MGIKTLILSLLFSGVIIKLSSVNVNTHTVYPIKATFSALTAETQKQVTCLAHNIYFEAKNEPEDGKLAVAFVTLNRLKSGNYGSTVCSVVKQKSRGVCQFSWYCDPNIARQRLTSDNNPLYNDILDMSIYLYLNSHLVEDITNGSTFYHADYVNPKWPFTREIKIGKHIFYKRKGDEIERENLI